MEVPTNSEVVPDPFEVGDDDLEDEATISAVKEPERFGSASPYHEDEIAINSAQESKVDLVPMASPTPGPSPPPKPVFRQHFATGVPSLISPSLFLPIPDVGCVSVWQRDLPYTTFRPTRLPCSSQSMCRTLIDGRDEIYLETTLTQTYTL